MKKKTHEQFVEKLKVIQPNLTVLNNYIRNNIHILVKDEYNIVYKLPPMHLLDGYKPSIRSSVDQNKAFKTKFELLKTDLIVLSDYIGYNKEIIVQDKCGINYKTSPYLLLQGHYPRLDSAIDKNSIIINRFYKVHGNKYDYSKVKYVNDRIKIEIICKKHGSFFQRVTRHTSGDGCIHCSNENNPGALINVFNNNPNNKICIYLFKCFNENEEFYKVGLSNKPKERSYQIPYNIEIIGIVHDTMKKLYPFEQELHKKFKQLTRQYKPKIKFSGWTECFK
jgi:hypothetical protein